MPVRPRIIVFTTAHHPVIGGAEIAVREILRRMPQYESHILVARLQRELASRETVDNTQVWRLGWGIPWLDKLFLPFASFWTARKIMSRGQTPTALWAVMASYGAVGALFTKLWRNNARFVLTFQEGDSEAHVRRRFGRLGVLRHVLLRNVDAATAISRYLAEFARRLGFYGRLFIIPNGVHMSAFDPGSAQLDHGVIKKSLGINDETRVVITTSRLVEKNGVEDIVRAFKILAEHYAPEALAGVIIGDGPLRPRIESVIQELELIDYIHVLGRIENDALISYLGVSDVFVRPSYSEGLGVSFLEAMAAGVPIVATPVGGIPDFLAHEETGLFCQPGDPQSIADAIIRLLEDDALRAKLIENAYRTVKERFEWDAVVKQMEEVFR